MKPSQILILPGWQSSGPGHWQSLWQQQFGYQWVEQHDWLRPLRGDWIARLEDVVLGCEQPVVLVAHSLGCLLVAAWASHSRNTHRVQAALLVAPGDAEQASLRPVLSSWSPIALQRLPAAGEIDALAAACGRPIADFTALNESLEDMLALLELLDDYIGVSNTNMHLRAAAGRAARVLVPSPSEWRWMNRGKRSPWFPQFSIYRQSLSGDWTPALAQLERDLATTAQA